MWEELIKLAVSNGIWAVLFVALLLYQLKDSATREVKYQETIASLTDKLNIVEDIRGDIADIKKSINKASKAKNTMKCINCSKEMPEQNHSNNLNNEN